MVSLIKALASGDTSGAKTDLAKLKTDLAAEVAAETAKNLSSDMASLLKDLNSGSTAKAKADAAKVTTDLQTQEAASSTKTPSPLDSVIASVSSSLSSGSVQGALQALSNYLIQSGQGTGTLLNTTA